jgi:hypothetical protein
METNLSVIARAGGRPSNPGHAEERWIPAFAGMTPENLATEATGAGVLRAAWTAFCGAEGAVRMEDAWHDRLG